ncbi:MAG TPA: SdrD B-like domain-containing protein [Anaerolineales bacterium]|nr:SdrD B-like domain-containing protein [Anaerolineales bacterium]
MLKLLAAFSPPRTAARAFLIIIFLIFSSCTPNVETKTQSPAIINTNSTESLPAPEVVTQITRTQIVLPPAINPLTGLPVRDPSLLDLPTMLVSISTFPVTARPQAGLSFAPYVFEVYITEGTTRYLTTFYGEFPAPESPITGHCGVRSAPFEGTDLIIGNRVWLDEIQNGTQDSWERGVGGVCVNLYAENLDLLQQTSTDSNGYYGFNVSAGRYFVAFAKPDGTEFSQKNVGDDDKDSDVDPASGWSDALDVTSSLLDLDLGLIQTNEVLPPSELPPAQVGPVRSGRLVYADIADFFVDSCLIFAYASSEVLVELPHCAFVDHNLQGGGYMLEINELQRLAQERRDEGIPTRYVSNIFSDEPPAGGQPASRLHVYIAWLNQTGWEYDPLSQSYWRYVDDGAPQTAGILHPEIDRLTGRQLQFENVIVLFAKHNVISPTNLDIHLERGLSGEALLFRDGQVFDIRWSTESEGPIQFQNNDGSLSPLKPGHTWVTIVTPLTAVTEQQPGEWLLQFSQPPGAK